MKAWFARVVAVNVLVFVLLLGLIEAACQIVVRLWPAYDVLFLQPDRVLGWKQVPNLQWTWTGNGWYAADFRVDDHANSLGFRDVDWSVAKPPDVRRVALLGDSFIEALQVPLEATAAKRLEQRLNSADGSGHPPVWEVMNFGISNYGIGQYLLTWKKYASQFHPRYVAALVARLHMERTAMEYEEGAFPSTRNRRLWIRPTFEMEGDTLVEKPARDFAEFGRIQDELIRTEFGGGRMRPKKQSVVLFYGRRLLDVIDRVAARWARPSVPDADEKLAAINFRILGKLGREVTAAGGHLALVDVSRDLGDPESVSASFREFCSRNGLAYVPAYRDLMDSDKSGMQTRWRHDVHFNERGNAILASDLYAWIASDTVMH